MGQGSPLFILHSLFKKTDVAGCDITCWFHWSQFESQSCCLCSVPSFPFHLLGLCTTVNSRGPFVHSLRKLIGSFALYIASDNPNNNSVPGMSLSGTAGMLVFLPDPIEISWMGLGSCHKSTGSGTWSGVAQNYSSWFGPIWSMCLPA